MLDLGKDIRSLSDFKRNTSELVDQMRQTGNPLVLTVNGRAQLVVQDAESYQQMLDALERAHALDGIRRGLDDVKRARTKPARAALDVIRRKHKIPRQA